MKPWWLFLFLPAFAHAAEWWNHALRLTGESQGVRRTAIRELRATPDLPVKLKAALSTEKKYLALDAVSALGLEELLPDLLAAAANDQTGAVYLATNTLLNEKTKETIAATYLTRLKGEKVPLPSLLVMLDTLGRTDTKIPPEDLRPFIRHADYEVRSAALYYLRYRLVKQSDALYLPLLAPFASARPYQLRVQLYSLVHDLPAALKDQSASLWNRCKEDEHPEVRQWCEELLR